MFINKICIIFFLLSFFIISCQAGCKFQFAEQNGQCQHKDLFNSFSLYDGLALTLIFIFSILASIGGAAGGIFFVPIYLLILNFDAQDSISSSICIMGITQILRMIISFKMRHPFRDRPIIDYSFAAMIAPSTFLGNIFGVLFNMWLANLVIKILFLVLIAFTFLQQTKKGIQVWKKEQQAQGSKTIQKTLETQSLKTESSIKWNKNSFDAEIQTNFSYLYQKYKKKNQIQITNNNINIEIQDDSNFIIEDLQSEAIPEHIKQQYNKYCLRETQYVYWNRLIPISIAFFLVAFVTYLKGSSKFNSIVGIQACSGLYWILMFITIPFIIIIILFVMREYVKENYIKQQVTSTAFLEDIEWNYHNVQKFCIFGIIVGFFQSFLGIGGGIIWTPILLSYKIPADVAAFTSQFLALLGAVNNLIQYLIMGHIVWDYVGMASLLAGISFIIGLKFILPYFQKKKKRSLIIFSLSIIEVGSFIVVLINSILQAKSYNDEGKSIWAMKNFCT